MSNQEADTSIVEHHIELIKSSNLITTWIPENYIGNHPPFFNLSIVNPHKGSDHDSLIQLTTRLPSSKGMGETNTVLFTHEMWAEFLARVNSVKENKDE